VAAVTVGAPPNAAATVQGAPASDLIVTPVTARVEPLRVAPPPLCAPSCGEYRAALPFIVAVDDDDDEVVVVVVSVALTIKAPGVLSLLNETVCPGSQPGKKWRVDSTDCNNKSLMACVAPTCSTPPPSIDGQKLGCIVWFSADSRWLRRVVDPNSEVGSAAPSTTLDRRRCVAWRGEWAGE
jgi:hypothetical protein